MVKTYFDPFYLQTYQRNCFHLIEYLKEIRKSHRITISLLNIMRRLYLVVDGAGSVPRSSVIQPLLQAPTPVEIHRIGEESSPESFTELPQPSVRPMSMSSPLSGNAQQPRTNSVTELTLTDRGCQLQGVGRFRVQCIVPSYATTNSIS